MLCTQEACRLESRQLSEKEFMAQVIQIALLTGWLVYHTHDSRKSAGPGWPDLAFCHPGRGDFFMAELKTAKGRLSREQQIWLAALRKSHIECYVFRPEDMDFIIARLTSYPHVHN
jgi:hypothetical protein